MKVNPLQGIRDLGFEEIKDNLCSAMLNESKIG